MDTGFRRNDEGGRTGAGGRRGVTRQGKTVFGIVSYIIPFGFLFTMRLLDPDATVHMVARLPALLAHLEPPPVA